MLPETNAESNTSMIEAISSDVQLCICVQS